MQIARGCGVPCIGDELSHRGVIGPSWVFNVYSRLHGDTNFKAGTYELKQEHGRELRGEGAEGRAAHRVHQADDPARASG